MITLPLNINGKKYPVLISLEDRDSYRVSIGKKGISIRIPQSISRDEMVREILKTKKWAKEQLERSPPKEEYSNEYHDGDKLIVGDKEYTLSIMYMPKQSSSAGIINNIISLNIASELSEEKQKKHISVLLSRVIARQRLPELESKIKQLNEKHFQANLNKVFFKKHRSKWGSCSSNNNVNISTKLLFAPDEVLEYVCIHELAHLKEHNHSKQFWALVETAMPNYKEKEDWLKKQGGNLGF
jgi:predicted metal-dependent hydrolase